MDSNRKRKPVAEEDPSSSKRERQERGSTPPTNASAPRVPEPSARDSAAPIQPVAGPNWLEVLIVVGRSLETTYGALYPRPSGIDTQSHTERDRENAHISAGTPQRQEEGVGGSEGAVVVDENREGNEEFNEDWSEATEPMIEEGRDELVEVTEAPVEHFVESVVNTGEGNKTMTTRRTHSPVEDPACLTEEHPLTLSDATHSVPVPDHERTGEGPINATGGPHDIFHSCPTGGEPMQQPFPRTSNTVTGPHSPVESGCLAGAIPLVLSGSTVHVPMRNNDEIAEGQNNGTGGPRLLNSRPIGAGLLQQRFPRTSSAVTGERVPRLYGRIDEFAQVEHARLVFSTVQSADGSQIYIVFHLDYSQHDHAHLLLNIGQPTTSTNDSTESAADRLEEENTQPPIPEHQHEQYIGEEEEDGEGEAHPTVSHRMTPSHEQSPINFPDFHLSLLCEEPMPTSPSLSVFGGIDLMQRTSEHNEREDGQSVVNSLAPSFPQPSTSGAFFGHREPAVPTAQQEETPGPSTNGLVRDTAVDCDEWLEGEEQQEAQDDLENEADMCNETPDVEDEGVRPLVVQAVSDEAETEENEEEEPSEGPEGTAAPSRETAQSQVQAPARDVTRRRAAELAELSIQVGAAMESRLKNKEKPKKTKCPRCLGHGKTRWIPHLCGHSFCRCQNCREVEQEQERARREGNNPADQAGPSGLSSAQPEQKKMGAQPRGRPKRPIQPQGAQEPSSAISPKKGYPNCSKCTAHGGEGRARHDCPWNDCGCAKCKDVDRKRQYVARYHEAQRQKKKAAKDSEHPPSPEPSRDVRSPSADSDEHEERGNDE